MTIFIIIRTIALIRLLQPVWAGLLLWTFHRAYVAYPDYVSVGHFDYGRPVDGHAWMLLASLTAVSILNFVSVMMLSMDEPKLEFRLPLREFRAELGLLIYFLALAYATVFTLTLVIGIGWLYINLMLVIYVIIALPLIVALIAAG
ncbi:hypothetical protein [Rhodobacter capsulatus]|uniref:hypothetical protein n=1 Tax=Rhodobacter capsulatus TaxID=1061 RepID=UPI004029DE4F